MRSNKHKEIISNIIKQNELLEGRGKGDKRKKGMFKRRRGPETVGPMGLLVGEGVIKQRRLKYRLNNKEERKRAMEPEGQYKPIQFNSKTKEFKLNLNKGIDLLSLHFPLSSSFSSSPLLYSDRREYKNQQN